MLKYLAVQVKNVSLSFVLLPKNFFVYVQKMNVMSSSNASSLISPETNKKFLESDYLVRLFEGLCDGQRSSLATAITLIESQHPKKQHEAQLLLSRVLAEARAKYLNYSTKSWSFRVGLTGPPGAGKSTFIETFGKLLTDNGHKVAVLTVDPSSTTTGGSLLGDKTRMPELSRDSHAYIRPSPTSGCLGGVTRSTNEAIVLCECAGYDTVIVETVGVGQSELDVAHMVDMFILVVPPAGGDELQVLKKGIVELVDLVAINKADGNFLPDAQRIQAEYTSALKFIKPRNSVWRTQVLRISSVTKEGITDMWQKMCDFHDVMLKSGQLELKRKQQYRIWMWSHIQNHLLSAFKSHPEIQALVKDFEMQVQEGLITPGQASDYLIKRFLK